MYLGPDLRPQQYQLPSGLPAMSPEHAGQTDVSGILATLWRRRRLFAAILLTCFGLVVLLTAVLPKKYTAEIKIIAGASSPTTNAASVTNSTLPMLNALLAAGNTMSSETYADLIQEYPVAEQVIRNLHLKANPYDLLTQSINVTPVTNTSIIALDATQRSSEQAIRVANEFGKVFVDRERDLIANQANSALGFLSTQMPLAEATMRKADSALAHFQGTHPNVYLTSVGTPSESSAVVTAQQRYATVQVDRQQAQAQLKDVLSQMHSARPTIIGASQVVQNPVISQLQTQLAQVEVQYQAARKQYTDAHPSVIALKEQKDQLEREIASQPPAINSGNDIVPNPVYQQLSEQAATLQAQIAADQAQLRTLSAELGQGSGPNNSLPVETAQLADLQRNAKMAEDIYSALQQKYGEATVELTTALSDVAVTQPADASSVIVKPSWIINLVLGFALGLVMATCGAFVAELLDNTFKGEEDVQRALPVPLLASVPQLQAEPSRRRLPWGRKNAQSRLPYLRALTIESFLQLVTALRYSSDKPLKTLAITSPSQRDGKTTVALSTGVALAEIEPKVLLVDADMRRPSLHERLGLQQSPGLSDVLVGEAALRDVIQPTKYDGLFLLPSGTGVPNPVKLIHSTRFDELVAELAKEYRAVIFDTPALQPVYDAALLAAKVDGAVLVAAAGMTDVRATKQSLQRLSSVQGVNIVGVVLNRATPANGNAYSYYLDGHGSTPLPHEDPVGSSS